MDPGSALAFARLSGMTGADFRFDFQTANLTLFVIASASEAIHISFSLHGLLRRVRFSQ